MLTKINTTTAGLSISPSGTPNSSRFGFRNSYFENAADTDSSLDEEERTEDDEGSQGTCATTQRTTISSGVC